MGKLIALATKRKTRAPMNHWEQLRVSTDQGLEHEDRHHSPHRQVTVVAREAWQAACDELGTDVPWTTRRANLFVEGVYLRETRGQRLRVGEVVLEITGETEPCERMNEAKPGLREVLVPEWRAGVTCRVLQGGTLQIGDPVELLPAEA